ncbi:MAG: hypothetical protein DMF86_05625 [Acidobacteria bacterium]|nr:MAG: hypothetical protein DMF86_05625 [Acidobacteriota bacterium]
MPDFRALVRREWARASPSDDVVNEVAQHVEDAWRAAKADGCGDAAAMARARAELADLQGRIVRPARSSPSRAPEYNAMAGTMTTFWRDLRFAARLIRGRPGFTAIAVCTLALAIGANTAIFSVVRSILLEPLPFSEPDRLVLLWEDDGDPAHQTIVSAPNFQDWTRMSRSFESTAIWEGQSFNLSGDGEAQRVSGMRVSSSVFHVLRVQPQLGRSFSADEDVLGRDRVLVVSDGLWRQRFGARRDIVGRTTRVNGVPYEIIGVMPAEFRFPTRDTAVWAPIGLNKEDSGRGSHSFLAAARLKDGVTFEAARAEMDAIGRALALQYPVDNRGESATITRMNDAAVDSLRPTLLALMGAVALVLAIACVNVANLLLAQASARRREFAVRAALGASTRRLASQLLAEGVLLGAIGGVAGLAVAWAGTRAFEGLLPESIRLAPFRDVGGIRADPIVLGFTLAISIATALLFSLAPIFNLWGGLRGGQTGLGLKDAGDRAATGRAGALRGVLVAAEVALAIVVLSGAGLMIKSIVRLLAVDPGLNPDNVLVMRMTLPQPDFYGPPVRRTFCDDVTARVGPLPGVRSVGAISHLPLSNSSAGRGLTVAGFTPPPGENPSATYRLTCPGYFQTMGIPILRGRDFALSDATDGPGVVIINELTAKKYWPSRDPIGQRLKIGRPESDAPWLTVVGIVGNVRHFGLDADVRREIYRPYSQAAWPVMTVVAKTASDPAGFAASVRAALQGLDRDLPVSAVTTMTQIEQMWLGPRRFPMILLSAFAAVALVLAVVGVYGVVSYVVAQRTREMGIRVALGARASQLLVLVVRGAMRPIVAGLILGVAGGAAAGRLLSTLLYQVSPHDPGVLGAIAGVLAVAAVAASLIPARRATTVDPILVLKDE